MQFRKHDARIFFAGQHQKRAGVFLTTSLRAFFNRVFGDEDHSPVMRSFAIGIGFKYGRENAA